MPHTFEEEEFERVLDAMFRVFGGEVPSVLQNMLRYMCQPSDAIDDWDFQDAVSDVRKILSRMYFDDERQRDDALTLLYRLRDERDGRSDDFDEKFEPRQFVLLGLRADMRHSCCTSKTANLEGRLRATIGSAQNHELRAAACLPFIWCAHPAPETVHGLPELPLHWSERRKCNVYKSRVAQVRAYIQSTAFSDMDRQLLSALAEDVAGLSNFDSVSRSCLGFSCHHHGMNAALNRCVWMKVARVMLFWEALEEIHRHPEKTVEDVVASVGPTSKVFRWTRSFSETFTPHDPEEAARAARETAESGTAESQLAGTDTVAGTFAVTFDDFVHAFGDTGMPPETRDQLQTLTDPHSSVSDLRLAARIAMMQCDREAAPCAYQRKYLKRLLVDLFRLNEGRSPAALRKARALSRQSLLPESRRLQSIDVDDLSVKARVRALVGDPKCPVASPSAVLIFIWCVHKDPHSVEFLPKVPDNLIPRADRCFNTHVSSGNAFSDVERAVLDALLDEFLNRASHGPFDFRELANRNTDTNYAKAVSLYAWQVFVRVLQFWEALAEAQHDPTKSVHGVMASLTAPPPAATQQSAPTSMERSWSSPAPRDPGQLATTNSEAKRVRATKAVAPKGSGKKR